MNIVKFIRYIEDAYVIGGEPFTYYDLYSAPLQSSKLNIFYIKKIDDSKAKAFSLGDNSHKYMIMPFKESFSAFPLNHYKFSDFH